MTGSLALSPFVVLGLALVGTYLWPDISSPMPAWIQAGGSVAAIVVSLLIIRIDHKEQREAAEIRAKLEQANLVLATYIFGLNTSAASSEFMRSGGNENFMKLSVLEYCINRMARVMEQAAQTPHWTMDLKEALTWTLMHRTAAKFEAALLLARAENIGDGSQYAITAGIRNSALACAQGVAIVQSASAQRYKELTGQEIPDNL